MPRGVRADPRGARWFALALAGVVISLLALNVDGFLATSAGKWIDWLGWTLFVLAINLLPVPVEDFQLTIDLPLLLAVGLAFGPEFALLSAVVGALDSRELRSPRIPVSRSVFNRSQIGISVFLASAVFVGLTNVSSSSFILGAAVIAALLTDYVINTCLVMLHMAASRQVRWTVALRRLTLERPVTFVVVHLGYGALAIVLVRLYQDVGMWSIYAFLIPLLAGRQMLLKGQALSVALDELAQKERQVEESLHRLTEARRQERVAIAGDLHDDVLQGVIHTRMMAEAIRREPDVPHQVREDAHQITVSADKTIAHIGKVISSLGSALNEDRALAEALSGLLRDLEAQWGTQIRLDCPQSIHLPRDARAVLCRVVQEGVVNAVKHSGTSEVTVSVTDMSDGVELQVLDDGVHQHPAPRSSNGPQLGILLMKSRVEGLGGTLLLDINANKGTRLRAWLPNQTARSPVP